MMKLLWEHQPEYADAMNRTVTASRLCEHVTTAQQVITCVTDGRSVLTLVIMLCRKQVQAVTYDLYQFIVTVAYIRMSPTRCFLNVLHNITSNDRTQKFYKAASFDFFHNLMPKKSNSVYTLANIYKLK
jgi:hypothetical protein